MSNPYGADCPRCGSSHIGRERRPDGDTFCVNCGYKAKEWPKEVDRRVRCPTCKDFPGVILNPEQNPLLLYDECPTCPTCNGSGLVDPEAL